MYDSVVMAGFGGQGILMIGNLLAMAGIKEDLNVTFFPSYGVEMRGGTANCTVTLSDREIGSPVTATPSGVIAMNEPSLVKFGPRVVPGGVIVVNSSIISKEAFASDEVRIINVPCNDIANKLGNSRLASMIALGAYVKATGDISPASLEAAMPEVLPKKLHKLIPLNVEALKAGAKSD